MYYRRSFAVITEALLDQLSIGIQDVTRADPNCVLSETCTKYNDDIHKITHPHLPKQFSEP